MPRLIHLNGPSRVGKSTLAHRYTDEHPGVLDLDLDVLAGLIGGWRADFSAALEVARKGGLAMAVAHLAGGHDVIVPQLVTIQDAAPGLEQAAADAGADYVEIVLMVDPDEHRRRLRAKRPVNYVEAHIQAALHDPTDDLVDRIRNHLSAHLANRPHAVRIDTTELGEDEAYARLLSVLDSL